MKSSGTIIQLNVDPTNPGQFFACCGLLELADRLRDGAEAMVCRTSSASLPVVTFPTLFTTCRKRSLPSSTPRITRHRQSRSDLPPKTAS